MTSATAPTTDEQKGFQGLGRMACENWAFKGRAFLLRGRGIEALPKAETREMLDAACG
jgi:hypothetical protein